MLDTIVKPNYYAYQLRVDIPRQKSLKSFHEWRMKYNAPEEGKQPTLFYIFGLEKSEATKKEHIQGIVWFHKEQDKNKHRNWWTRKADKTHQPVSFTSAKKITNLSKYCMKQGKFFTNLKNSEIKDIGKWKKLTSHGDFTKKLFDKSEEIANKLKQQQPTHQYMNIQKLFVLEMLAFYRTHPANRPTPNTLKFLMWKVRIIDDDEWYERYIQLNYH